jgi:hypothetical protein
MPVLNERDLRIDFLRGVALLMISIDHAPANLLSLGTLRAYSFGDAAELFFFMSGYVAALVYGRTLARKGLVPAMARIYRRARDLYLAQIALLGGVALFLYGYSVLWEDTSVIGNFRLAPLVAEPARMMTQALALRYQPTYMDILPGYVALFLVLPFMLWLLQRNVWLALSASFAVYLGVQSEGWALHTLPDGHAWLFNPFAWQFLFMLGAAFGSRKLDVLLPFLRSRAALAVSLIFALPVAVMVGSATWHGFLPAVPSLRFLDVATAKEMLPPFRILSFLALAHLGWWFLPPGEVLARYRVPRLVMKCGQQSLSIFSAGVVLAALSSVIYGDWRSQWAVCAATAVGIALLVALAWCLDWVQKNGLIANRMQSAAAT